MGGQMPVMDGRAARGQSRADLDPVIASDPIIALTASVYEGDRQRCLDAGTNHHISKPARPKDLEVAI